MVISKSRSLETCYATAADKKKSGFFLTWCGMTQLLSKPMDILENSLSYMDLIFIHQCKFVLDAK